jgi:signal transduction histidine kinase
VIDDVLQILSEAAGRKGVRIAAESPPTCRRRSRDRVRRVLINLVDNGIGTRRRADVTVRARRGTGPRAGMVEIASRTASGPRATCRA